jgi:hypothetical protein
MLIEELFGAVRDKEEVLQRLKSEIMQIEKDIETLKAAAKILEREPRGPQPLESRAISASHAPAPETIRKAFP